MYILEMSLQINHMPMYYLSSQFKDDIDGKQYQQLSALNDKSHNKIYDTVSNGHSSFDKEGHY